MLKAQASGDDSTPSIVKFKKPRPREMPHYELPDNQLSHGASLGNKKLWVNTKATGAVERVFCNAIGINLLGSIVVTYAVPSKVLITSSPEPQCLDSSDINYVIAEQDGTGVIQIYPFWQKHSFDLSGELHVKETILVPKMLEDDPPVVLKHIEITNNSGSDMNLLVTVYADLQGDLGEDLQVRFDKELSALVVNNISQLDYVRIIGAESCEIAYRTTHDLSEGYAGTHAKKLDQSMMLSQAPIGQLQLGLEVKAGKTAHTTITAAIAAYKQIIDYKSLQDATQSYLTPAVSLSMVETPDPIINQGIFWAKVNMLKVMASYPEGNAFTNEPGVSSNVVGRDMAWFVYGCDYLNPEFS